jgi:hypothetical protein
MQSKATNVKDYLSSLTPERRGAIEAVRKVILKNLDKEYEEGMSYGMIGYCVPHSRYPAGYHCNPAQALPFAALASQKNHMAVYMMCMHGSEDHAKWFKEAWAKAGKKLDKGVSCVRFKKVEDLALDVIGEAIRRMPAKKFIASYEAALLASGKRAGKKGSSSAAKKSVPKPAKTAAPKANKVVKKNAHKPETKR